MKKTTKAKKKCLNNNGKNVNKYQHTTVVVAFSCDFVVAK